MADIIKCSVCGENNSSDQEFCQYCRSPLGPSTGTSKATNAPIKPGQVPTRKNTAELEPILPQWLRDARDSARKSAEEDSASHIGKQSQDSFSASGSDLLAGLQSQTGGEDEETPDWLTSITANTPKAKKPETESSEMRRVELGGAKDFAHEEPSSGSSNEKDNVTDWLQDAGAPLRSQASDQQASTGDSYIASSDTPDWLRQMAADHETKNEGSPVKPFDSPPASSDTTDWLHQLGEDASIDGGALFIDAEPSTDADAALPQGDTPDWLSSLGGAPEKTQSADSAIFTETGPGEPEAVQPSSEVPSNDGLPQWMKDSQPAESEPSLQSETPAWLQDGASLSSESSADFELPSWLSAGPATPDAIQDEQPAPADDLPLGDIPDWLKAAAPQSSIYSDLPTEKIAPSSDAEWLDSIKSKSSEKPAEEIRNQEASVFSTDEVVDVPAFTPEAGASYNTDSLFTDMPEWLSNAVDDSNSSAASMPVDNDLDSLTPGELPSWVQAMRPFEPGTSQRLANDQTFESRGALAGFQGVLPLVPGYTPTSKPKIYTNRLHTSDEQTAQAALLEQILTAETAPVPIASFSTLPASKRSRWLIAFILIAALGTVLFLRTQIFSQPVGVPYEVNGAFLVSQAIPEGAPVLVAFDYEPARAGEMEAAASPMFNLMKNPNFTFISTNATGAILAERFVAGPLADTDQGGIQRLNLGYLPGGQMGIRVFAKNPAYLFPQLADVKSISQFAALIIITDNADSARAWIEQTSSTRGTIPLVVISSAQAAPMIRPYYDSQQISGLVGGLYGSAVFEQNMSGGSGISRRYWDAYSVGMLLAMALILGGGLFNLVLGLRERAQARETK
jgi:hypothetical protein